MPVMFNRSMGRYRPGGPSPVIRGDTMLPGVNAQWLGLKTIEARLKKLPEELEKLVTNYALWKASEVVYDEVRAQAPVRSGRLRDSVKRQRRYRGRPVRGIRRRLDQVDIGATAPYWHIVEFGAAPAEASGFKGSGGPRVLSRLRNYTAEGASFAESSGGGDAIIGPRRKALRPHRGKGFIRPAFEVSHQQAQDTFKKSVEKKMLSAPIKNAMESIQLD